VSIHIPHFIGTTESGNKIELQKDAATQGFAVLGKRGRGKSNLAGCMIEIFAAEQVPFVVFDPPGAHWGIRFEAGENGQPIGPSGFDVLLIGGDNADIQLEQTDAKELANIIVDSNLSVVINMKAMTYTAQQRYYADFSEELFRINRTVRHLFFEESQNFAPQMLKFDEQKRALYATEKLIDEGRGIGLGFTLISQRPAAVNKSVLTQTDNFLALGMFAPQDIDQVEDWFKHHVRGDKEKLREIVDEIAGMQRGECWLLSPDWKGTMVKFHVRERVTYHAGRTPKPGERTVNVSKFSVTEAVEKLKKAFTTKQVARHKEAQDLGEANKRIRELEKQLRASSHKSPSNEAAKQEDPKAIARAVINATKTYRKMLAEQAEQFRQIVGMAERIVTAGQRNAGREIPEGLKISGVEIQKGEGRPTGHAVEGRPEPQTPPSRPKNHFALKGDDCLPPGERATLIAASQYSEGVERNQLSVLTGYRRSSRDAYLFRLKQKEFIEERGGRIVATPSGIEALGNRYEPLPEGKELQNYWLERLPEGERKILEILLQYPGESVDREALDEATGYKRSSRDAYLSRLAARRIIESVGRGQVKVAELLFS